MNLLNLPEFDFKIQKKDNQLYIFDFIRKKYVFLTPEEWVRQNLLRHLTEEIGYSKSLIKVESGLKYDKRQKRSDILVYNNLGNPFLLLECKSMEIPLSQATLEQVAAYNHTIQSKHVAISNGIHFAVFEVDYEKREMSALENFPKA